MTDFYVQSNSANTDPGTLTVTVVLTGVTAGNTLLAFSFNGSSTTSPPVVGDGQSATWTVRGSDIADVGDNVVGTIYQLDNANAGTHTVVGTVGVAEDLFLCVVEVATTAATPFSGTHGQFQSSPGTGAGAVSSGSMTVSAASTLVSFSTDSASLSAGNEPAAVSGTSRLNGTAIAIGAWRLQTQAASAAAAGTFTAVAGADSYITLGVAILNGTPSGFTLTASNGSYSITGEAATLSNGLPLADGVYSLAGQAATLSQGTGNFSLLATAGSYALFGFPSNSNLQLDAANGSYAIVGENTNNGITLAAAFGSYAMTGEAVTLTQSGGGSFNLSAAFGTYSITGEATNNAIKFPAAFGSYAITGEAVTLTQAGGPTLIAASGAYALTGQAVTLSESGFSLVATFGSYGLAGENITTSGSKPAPVWFQPPLNFSLTVNGQSSVTLNWTPFGSSVVIGYYVFRDKVLITPTPIVGGTFTDTTVTADRRYMYAVSAVDLSLAFGPQTLALEADVLTSPNLTFEAVFQEQPGEGGYPDVLWKWR